MAGGGAGRCARRHGQDIPRCSAQPARPRSAGEEADRHRLGYQEGRVCRGRGAAHRHHHSADQAHTERERVPARGRYLPRAEEGRPQPARMGRRRRPMAAPHPQPPEVERRRRLACCGHRHAPANGRPVAGALSGAGAQNRRTEEDRPAPGAALQPHAPAAERTGTARTRTPARAQRIGHTDQVPRQRRQPRAGRAPARNVWLGRDPARERRQDPRGAAPALARFQTRAGDLRSVQLLEQCVLRSEKGAQTPLSQARLARRPMDRTCYQRGAETETGGMIFLGEGVKR